MASSLAAASYFLSSSSCVIPTTSPTFLKSQQLLFQTPPLKTAKLLSRSPAVKSRATLDERDQQTTTPLDPQEEQSSKGVEESVKVLKNAAKTRRVAAEEVLSALSVIKKAKIDPSPFLETLGGSKSPGRTWMLIFTTVVYVFVEISYYFRGPIFPGIQSHFQKWVLIETFLRDGFVFMVLGASLSLFCYRVEWALKIKGLE